MNLHLIDDKKFIKGAVDLFEEYYPESNHFFIQISRSEKFVEYKKLNYTNVTYSAFTRRKDINSILKFAKEKQVKNIFVHNLTPLKAAITSRIKKNTFAKTYWIFYGADLYGQLNALGKYDLLDSEEKPSKNQNDSFRSKLLFKYLFNSAPMKSYLYFIKQLDFFCFWNEYDYFLLKKHFKTSAIYKPFLYYGLIDRSHSIFDFNNCVDKVLINNSASANGNHATVLKKISELDGSDVLSEIITPLSYGNQEIKNSTLKYGYELFGVKFKPIKEYLPIDEYYALISNVPVAIFGHRRQEAAGNIFYLIGKGVKIFLRNDNNMISWFRDRGFIVYSFEDNLSSINDLRPLTYDERKINIDTYKNIFSKEAEFRNMNLLCD